MSGGLAMPYTLALTITVQIIHEDTNIRTMEQLTIPEDTSRLFEQIITLEELKASFNEVRRNQGAPGIDGVSISDFSSNLNEELSQLQAELSNWSYKPRAVRRVEIPKPNGGVRLLGVPCVRDRVVQTAIKRAIEPILDSTFSEHSYGFRPGRNQRQAVESAQKIVVEEGKELVVDIDLSKFFDRVNHDRLLALLKKHYIDKRVLRLIGMILRSGVMIDGRVEATREGTPQGGPLSPLLSNVILDELDKELEKRKLSFCRFADDCNIFVRSRKAAERVMVSISQFIENKLKLVVNREKSQVARTCEVKFLGMTIVNGTIAISRKAMSHAMAKVKELTPRGTYLTLELTIAEINRWYVGWSNYFNMTQYPKQLNMVEGRIRRRLRARIVSQFGRKRYLARELRKRGVQHRAVERAVFSNRKKWALSNTWAVKRAYGNKWFEHAGLITKSGDELPHWFYVKRGVRFS